MIRGLSSRLCPASNRCHINMDFHNTARRKTFHLIKNIEGFLFWFLVLHFHIISLSYKRLTSISQTSLKSKSSTNSSSTTAVPSSLYFLLFFGRAGFFVEDWEVDGFVLPAESGEREGEGDRSCCGSLRFLLEAVFKFSSQLVSRCLPHME